MSRSQSQQQGHKDLGARLGFLSLGLVGIGGAVLAYLHSRQKRLQVSDSVNFSRVHRACNCSGSETCPADDAAEQPEPVMYSDVSEGVVGEEFNYSGIRPGQPGLRHVPLHSLQGDDLTGVPDGSATCGGVQRQIPGAPINVAPPGRRGGVTLSDIKTPESLKDIAQERLRSLGIDEAEGLPVHNPFECGTVRVARVPETNLSGMESLRSQYPPSEDLPAHMRPARSSEIRVPVKVKHNQHF